MQELREAQKALIAAKKRRNRESENYLRTRIGSCYAKLAASGEEKKTLSAGARERKKIKCQS
jgi:hypothetical protein